MGNTLIMMKEINWYVEGHGAWFICRAATKNEAKQEGIKEWGRVCLKSVRKATTEEVKYFISMKGENGL